MIYKKSTRIFSLVTFATMIAFAGCGKKASSSKSNSASKIKIKASSMLSLNSNAALTFNAKNFLAQKSEINLFAGPESPDTANNEYDGMGVHTSEAIVESLKVHITSVSFGTKAPGTTGGSVKEFKFDKELEISEGVTTPVEVDGTIEEGTYAYAAVGFKPQYTIQAYAYFDTDNDGSIDTTVFTTPAGIQKVGSRLAKAAMTDYGPFKYGFMYTHCSNSITNSTDGNCGTMSIFAEPVTIAKGTSNTVQLLIDSTNVVTSWTGGVGTYQFAASDTSASVLGDTSKIPFAINFPLSSTCSDTANPSGLKLCDFFPVASPAFRLSYLPAFAFLNGTNLSSQVYLVSTESGSFNHYNSVPMQLVLSNGEPIMGLTSGKLVGQYDQNVTPWKHIGGQSPVVGAVSRLFEKVGTSYKFHMDYGTKDADGKNDGGLYYNNDKTMAGYIGDGFTLASAVGGTSSITVQDGPRCKEEYDYCIGARTYYLKRVK